MSRVDLVRALAQEEDKLLTCVHCGFCLPACPTYVRLGNEADSPRGRLHQMRGVLEGRIEPDAADFRTHIDQCLGCRACEPVCPSGVRYGFLLERTRAVIAEAAGVPLVTRLLLGTFRHPRLMRLAMAAARLLRDTRVAGLLVRVLPAAFGRVRFGLAMLASSRAVRLPLEREPGPQGAPHTPPHREAPAGRVEERRAPVAAEDRHADPATAELPPVATAHAGAGAAGDEGAARVAILEGCVQRGLFGRVNRATTAALRAAACPVVPAPGQGCCGALHAHAGMLDDARELAARNTRAFDRSGAELVAVNAAGCGAFMKEYGELLEGTSDHEAAERVAASVRDVAEILDGRPPVMTLRVPLTVAYDEACHLHHGQAVGSAPQRCMDRVPGIRRAPLERADECCGGAGIYGLLHPRLGGWILDDKLDDIQRSGAALVATGNPGCMMQIGAGLLLRGDERPVVHPIELIAAACGDDA